MSTLPRAIYRHQDGDEFGIWECPTCHYTKFTEEQARECCAGWGCPGCGARLSAHEKTTGDGVCFGCRAAKRAEAES